MKKLIMIFILTLTVYGSVYSQSDLWTDIPETQVALAGERYIIPDVFRTVKVNIESLKNLLTSAPMEFTKEANDGLIIIELPMPDGTFQEFKFWESPTMAPELQVLYPEIRTYTGQGVTDPYATLKFDLTPHGFHAQVLSPSGRVFIDPYSMGDTNHYISYYTKDFHKHNADYSCELLSNEFSPGEKTYPTDEILTPTGPQLRTYRLAVATTVEYTVFHGGTVALGLSAVVTSVNRVNGVYERETAIRMVLIANNNLIIYTTSPDPYTNGSGSTMLGQNISNLSTVIGNANFDIGHVFSTGGGGVAYLGCVCTTSKAGGVTGSSSPVGDPFDIDYVAHEMGHQFGANHTFNSVTGSCGGGNRNASTAYEPGSGSTIMAYAGICSTDDLQSNSDAYFHTISFDEIVAFTNTGSGNGCAVTTLTGNNTPVVSVPTGGFTIPKSTPFSLTGSATDPNGDAMTYCWEEFDLGPAGTPGSPSGDAPIFRSFNPVANGTRTFPKLTDLLNNTSSIGELLPTYARNLKFRLTVRDNKAGGGGVDRLQVNFSVSGTAGPFVVTSPNTNVSWTGNTSQTITWSVASTNLSPINCSNVRILLSTNGGNTFTTELLANTPNDGSEIVTIPNFPTTQARIKVEAVGNIFFDISNVNFTIVNNPGASNPVSFAASPTSSSQIELTFEPNASNNNVIIVWNNTGTFTTPSGIPPSVGSLFAGGTLIYNGTSSPQLHAGLSSGANYYYKAFSYNGSTYSAGLTSNTTTFAIQNPGTFSAFAISQTEIYLVFATNIVGNNVVIVWNNNGSFTTPAGTPPAIGQTFAGGTLLYNGISSPQIHNSLTPAQNYFYKAFSFDGTNYSSGIVSNDTTFSTQTTFQLSVPISQGWNIVSIPGLHPVNQNVNTWWSFREPLASVYSFSGGSYIPVDSVLPGRGYYMLHPDNRIYNTGDEWPSAGIITIPHNNLVVTSGWNIIGGYEQVVPVNSLNSTPPGIIVANSIYGWSGSYYNAVNLEPGLGYWVLVNNDGVINLSSLENQKKLTTNDEEKFRGQLKIIDAKGNNFKLYIADDEVDLESYQLPPLPPAGLFDVRFSTGKKAEYLEFGSQTINMQGVHYPLTISSENIDISIKDLTGRTIVPVLKSGNDIQIDFLEGDKLIISKAEVPDEYCLEQNYPNPFNPGTTIKFSVPKQTQLKINLFNSLGEFIRTLADGLYEAGNYKINVDASDLPSSIYIYRLESSESVITNKMILLK
ncbi:MAG: T9SS type A sorting domain-containing protein [Ignavibacteriales bacterium]|nr:MAG: T9SS type A sorting domain-containing protein [Ignavibacteriales bacterium]